MTRHTDEHIEGCTRIAKR